MRPFFPNLDFLAAYENPYIVLYINRSLKCRDAAPACNLLCSPSGTALIRPQKKGAMQSSVMPHQHQADLSGDTRSRQIGEHSLPDASAQPLPSVTGSGAGVLSFVCLIKRNPLCLWPITQSSECEILVGNMSAITSMWPGLVCIMLECIRMYHVRIHLLLPGAKIIASSVPLAKARK